tara:strand:+ start:673 stop:1449 length:777 start_codon:yes stop_codon:yes gene_type:complete
MALLAPALKRAAVKFLMATIKVACPKCGQKVSGDDSFFGTSVDCPICSAVIKFPESASGLRGQPSSRSAPSNNQEGTIAANHDWDHESEQSKDKAASKGAMDDFPPAFSDEVVPQTHQPEHDFPPEEKKESARGEGEAEKKDQDVDEDDGDDEGGAEIPSPMYGAISLISAILGLVTCLGVVFAPVAIIFGHSAGAKARNSPVQPAPGQALGLFGMLIGYVNLVFTIIALIVVVILKETNPEFAGWMKGLFGGESGGE